ncbi:hypothetical protein CCR75_004876 [Bremia lactucae]|uniref:TAFII55 protein conserved region domain-containing protein n=1 Tax=Bremia lactucae TaxID=4779 RepID=A0A976NYI5_BRELC|nr:hypothetical protein CCR75_004876 [Bremia lactucae]
MVHCVTRLNVTFWVPMEQYLLQLPKRLAQQMRAGIANGDAANVDMVAGADNKHFTMHVNGKKYPAKIEKEDEKKTLEAQIEVPNGLTPPNTNVIKRKYEKTKKTTPFPKSDVSRVEEDLVKIIGGGVIEDVQEELVDYYDWMTDEEHPNGIIVTDEMELIREHPEYLTLSEEPMATSRKLLPPSMESSLVVGTANTSMMNTPLVTDAGSEAESQTDGRASVQRSPVFAPTPSPRLSPMELLPPRTSQENNDMDDEKEVDLLEDDILDGMDTKVASSAHPKAYLTDPAYLKLLPIRDRLHKSMRDAERDMSELSAKVDANSNIIVKNRFKQMLETANHQRTEIARELDKVVAEITTFESR